MKRTVPEELIAKEIESLRLELIQCGIKEGLTSKRTIELSQTLDKYIIKYQLKNSNHRNLFQ